MTKKEAQRAFTQEVNATAHAWMTECGDDPLDTEWSGTAFEDIDSAILTALAMDDPWRMFHDAVQARIDELNV